MSFKAVFFTVIGAICFLITLFVVGGLMMPRMAKVTRTVEIQAPSSFIFPYLNAPRNFTEWSPWQRYDSKIFYSYEGARSGEGASIYWASDHEKVGSGSQIITKSIENKEIETQLRFGDNRRAEAGFLLMEENGVTSVTWHFTVDFGYDLFRRYMGPFMDQYIGEEYEIGLTQLKKLVENDYAQQEEASPQIQEPEAPTNLLAPK